MYLGEGHEGSGCIIGGGMAPLRSEKDSERRGWGKQSILAFGGLVYNLVFLTG